MTTLYEVRVDDIHARTRREREAKKLLTSLSNSLFSFEENSHYIVSTRCFQLLREGGISVHVIKEIDGNFLEDRIIYPQKSILYSRPEQGAIEEVCAKLYSLKEAENIPYVVFLGRHPNLEKGAFFLDRTDGIRKYQWRISKTVPQETDIRQSFPNLIKLVRDKHTKFVVSFGAGGLRLFAHPSVMKFLNLIGLRKDIDEIWGCSGGASAGYVYAMDVAPEVMEQEGYDIYNERYKISLSPSFFSVLKNIFFDTLFPSSPDLLKGFASCQQSLQTAISHLTQGKHLKTPFYCIAFNVKNRRTQILTPLPVDTRYGDLMISADPIDAIVASSSIPILYVPKVIRRGLRQETYVDGAVAEDLPLVSIYRKWKKDHELGIEKKKRLVILGVELFPHMIKSWMDSSLAKRLPFVDLVRYGLGVLDFMRDAHHEEQLEMLHQHSDVTILNVACPLKTAALLDTKAIPVIIKNAQSLFLEQFLALEKSIA